MADFLDTIFKTWNDFQAWTPSSMTLYPMLGLSLACAFIVSYFAAAPRLFTVPIGFIVLFFAANLSNFLAHGLFISGLSDLQKTIMFSIIGDCVAAIILLAVFRVSARR